MAGIITTLGHDPVGMKRATETALRQTAGEIDRLEALIRQLYVLVDENRATLEDHEERIEVLEP